MEAGAPLDAKYSSARLRILDRTTTASLCSFALRLAASQE